MAVYRVSTKTCVNFKKSKHQNLLEYVYKYGDITYINSKYFFSHQQNLCALLPLLEASEIQDDTHLTAECFCIHPVL